MTNKQPNTRAGEAQARQLATALMSVERFTADGNFHPDYLAMLTRPLPQPSELDAMQAERDKATADLGAIDEIAAMYGWGKPDADIGKKTVAAIAAAYRVETDPLVEAFRAIQDKDIEDGVEWSVDITRRLSAELAKRGLEIGEKNA